MNERTISWRAEEDEKWKRRRRRKPVENSWINPIRGIQTTRRMNHSRSSTTRTHEISKSKNESAAAHMPYSSWLLHTISKLQTSPSTTLPRLFRGNVDELKVGLVPYEMSGIDRKGNVDTVRQDVWMLLWFRMSNTEIGEELKRQIFDGTLQKIICSRGWIVVGEERMAMKRMDSDAEILIADGGEM